MWKQQLDIARRDLRPSTIHMEKSDAMFSDDDDNHEEPLDRRTILSPAIYNVITALGGYEGDTYILGDECYGCLKDLKKFWRKDDTDDERTVARIFWESRVLRNDLIPILLETAGKGMVDNKCAIACADIITAMTWPIDLAEELKELDEELDRGTDYTQLLQSHLSYKADLLRPEVINALLGILLPCIAKDKKERKERDVQIISVILYLFRNLAFIKDQPPNVHSSANQVEFSSLQSKLIKLYAEMHVLDLFLTVASNAKDVLFNQWNTLILETLYLLFRSVQPAALAVDQTKRQQNSLKQLLEAENKLKLEYARNASSRHSRFGTTIAVTLNSAKSRQSNDGKTNGTANTLDGPSQSVVLHKQQALNKEAGSILDANKRKKWRKGNTVDELGLQDNLTYEAKNVLQSLAERFLKSCFNDFLASLLKDIKSERPKIHEKDHLRLLFVTKWFLEFFLALREKQKSVVGTATATAATAQNKKQDAKNGESWEFELIGEVVERSWIIWMLKRMREAMEAKPKMWTELQAGIECLTQLLLLIDAMSSFLSPINSESDTNLTSDLTEASDLLRQQIIYNGDVLDISVEALQVYKEGVQSLKYLDASVRLAYSLLRMLERWAKLSGKGENGEMYVRKKKVRRRKKKNDDDENPDEDMEKEQDEYEDTVQETIFTFDAFEFKFVHEEITYTLLAYLSRYQEFESSEQMKRVVSLMHRQAVKAKAEGLFFKVSTLNLFKSILARQLSLPKDQPYKDLVSLINFILRKFFKAVNEDSMILIEAFFPKNRSRWKKYSSWEDEKAKLKLSLHASDDEADSAGNKGGSGGAGGKGGKGEVQIKKGYSWSEQVGIAVKCLVEDGLEELVGWAREILTISSSQRQRIVEDVDGPSDVLLSGAINGEDGDKDEDEAVREAAAKLRKPSNEAVARFEDYMIPYVSDERADAATKNAHLKLMFRLLKFGIIDENADELEWYVPASILPSDLQSSERILAYALANPPDLDGKRAQELLTAKRRRRRRRHHSSSSSDESNAEIDGAPDKKKKPPKRQRKEKVEYKSAPFIEDSDAELGGEEEEERFWARERELRLKTARKAVLANAANASGNIDVDNVEDFIGVFEIGGGRDGIDADTGEEARSKANTSAMSKRGTKGDAKTGGKKQGTKRRRDEKANDNENASLTKPRSSDSPRTSRSGSTRRSQSRSGPGSGSRIKDSNDNDADADNTDGDNDNDDNADSNDDDNDSDDDNRDAANSDVNSDSVSGSGSGTRTRKASSGKTQTKAMTITKMKMKPRPLSRPDSNTGSLNPLLSRPKPKPRPVYRGRGTNTRTRSHSDATDSDSNSKARADGELKTSVLRNHPHPNLDLDMNMDLDTSMDADANTDETVSVDTPTSSTSTSGMTKAKPRVRGIIWSDEDEQ